MSYIMDKVNEARRLFMIDSYPGDFFEFINETNYTKRYGLLLFKEDIGKLSGFIGYGAGELTLICVNYKRPIGHQNFTLAHELGHWFLHKGQSFSDELLNISMNGKNRESEANQFAIELLYPHNCFIDDCKVIEAEDLLHEVYRKKLGEYIDLLCHRYCLSYAVVLRKVLGHYNLFSEYEQIRKEIEKALGGKA